MLFYCTRHASSRMVGVMPPDFTFYAREIKFLQSLFSGPGCYTFHTHCRQQEQERKNAGSCLYRHSRPLLCWWGREEQLPRPRDYAAQLQTAPPRQGIPPAGSSTLDHTIVSAAKGQFHCNPGVVVLGKVVNVLQGCVDSFRRRLSQTLKITTHGNVWYSGGPAVTDSRAESAFGRSTRGQHGCLSATTS